MLMDKMIRSIKKKGLTPTGIPFTEKRWITLFMA
jgi:hypothetical protein